MSVWVARGNRDVHYFRQSAAAPPPTDRLNAEWACDCSAIAQIMKMTVIASGLGGAVAGSCDSRCAVWLLAALIHQRRINQCVRGRRLLSRFGSGWTGGAAAKQLVLIPARPVSLLTVHSDGRALFMWPRVAPVIICYSFSSCHLVFKHLFLRLQ